MLMSYEATNFLGSRNEAPEISKHEKLAIIAGSPVELQHANFGNGFSVRVPFVKGASFYVSPEDAQLTGVTLLNDFQIGDNELCKAGIGTRLLKSGIAQAISMERSVRSLHVIGARLGTLNTIRRIAGDQNVGVSRCGNNYGNGSDRPIGAIFDDYPFVPEKDYVIDTIDAAIPLGEVCNWEVPVLKPSATAAN